VRTADVHVDSAVDTIIDILDGKSIKPVEFV
jgi:hypothetical protein